MNRRLLVPLDGMPLAERALPLARVLAGVLSADVQLLQVIPLGHAAAAEAEAHAHAYLAEIAASPANVPFEVATRVLHGDPGTCIVQVATTDDIAAVVMTTHARSGMRRAVLGSVAEYVVAHCPAPTVLTSGDGMIPRSLRTVLVTIDSSCVAPLPNVIELAAERDVRVVLLGSSPRETSQSGSGAAGPCWRSLSLCWMRRTSSKTSRVGSARTACGPKRTSRSAQPCRSSMLSPNVSTRT